MGYRSHFIKILSVLGVTARSGLITDLKDHKPTELWKQGPKSPFSAIFAPSKNRTKYVYRQQI
jgi:hypothetical protein